jgi:hypothetical protein
VSRQVAALEKETRAQLFEPRELRRTVLARLPSRPSRPVAELRLVLRAATAELVAALPL